MKVLSEVCWPAAIAAIATLVALLMPVGANAQAQLSAEEARLIEFGKEIFKSKAVCQYCHKWDASGDQGYGGNALSLRVTQLTPEQLTEVVKCGRPGTGMPYHDRFAYTDKQLLRTHARRNGQGHATGRQRFPVATRDRRRRQISVRQGRRTGTGNV